VAGCLYLAWLGLGLIRRAGLPTADTREPHGLPTADAREPHGLPTTDAREPHGLPTTDAREPHGLPTTDAREPHGLPAADTREPHGLPTASVAGLFVFQFLNPKAWLMVVSALGALPPGDAGSRWLLAATFTVIPTVCLVLWAVVGAAMARVLARPRVARWVDRAMGVLLIATAVALLGAACRSSSASPSLAIPNAQAAWPEVPAVGPRSFEWATRNSRNARRVSAGYR
jgi:threonine/homoserine/homoserine lactone efflux protein